MFDEDLNVASGLGGGARVSTDAALFLSKKVAAAQREIVHQLRTEAADQARPETSKKDSEKLLANGRKDHEDERKTDLPVNTSDDNLDGTQQLNITV